MPPNSPEKTTKGRRQAPAMANKASTRVGAWAKPAKGLKHQASGASLCATRLLLLENDHSAEGKGHARAKLS